MSEVPEAGAVPEAGTQSLSYAPNCRRESTDPKDIFYGLISGIDAMARGLRNAVDLKKAGLLDDLKAGRYSSWHTGLGEAIKAGGVRRWAW